MSREARGLIFVALIAVAAGAACWFAARYTAQSASHEKGDAHAWIHTQLGITPEQDRALDPIEDRYAEQKKHYGEMLRIANDELGRAMLEDRGSSERVKAAVARIHEAQGELQNAALQHIFEMKPVLTPQQYDKLLRSSAAALRTAEHGR